MKNSTTKPPSSPESVDAVERFDTSLRELRDLRAQLHFAADICEQTFSMSKDRKTMIEDTKEYICRAMVTVVDHLGNVSANVECLLSGTARDSETEFRLRCLDQKLLTCRQYAEMVDIPNMRSRNALLPRYHRRYSSTSTSPCDQLSPLQRSTEAVREVAVDNSKAPPEPEIRGLNHCYKDGEVPDVPQTIQIPHVIKSLYTSSISVRGTNPAFTSLLPACDGPSLLSKPRTPYFGSWPKGARKHGAEEEEQRRGKVIIVGTHQLVSDERTKRMAPIRSNLKVFLQRSIRELQGAK